MFAPLLRPLLHESTNVQLIESQIKTVERMLAEARDVSARRCLFSLLADLQADKRLAVLLPSGADGGCNCGH